MVKLCDKTLVYPFKPIFKASFQGIFLECWEKALYLFTKKESKNLLKIYRPTSLLLIIGIYKKIIFKGLFYDFHQNQLFTKSQSGFLPGDSYISQLSIVYSSFDRDPTIHVGGVFLDISTVFDTVWFEGTLFKLKTYGAKFSRMKQVKFFKGCLPQILLDLFLNTLSHILMTKC